MSKLSVSLYLYMFHWEKVDVDRIVAAVKKLSA